MHKYSYKRVVKKKFVSLILSIKLSIIVSS